MIVVSVSDSRRLSRRVSSWIRWDSETVWEDAPFSPSFLRLGWGRGVLLGRVGAALGLLWSVVLRVVDLV